MIVIKYFLLVAGFLATFFYITFSLESKESARISELNTLSEEIYKSANSKEYSTSDELLKSFEEDYLELQESSGALENGKAVTVSSSIKQTEKSIQNLANLDATAKDINDITSFRFLVNALSNTDHPLWASVQPQMVETISKASLALQNNEYESYNRYLSDFFTQYNVIYDSLKVDINSEALETFDQHVRSLEANHEEIFATADAENELGQIQSQLEMLQKLIEVEANPISDLMVFSMIFSFISLTLVYVGWKKHSFQK